MKYLLPKSQSIKYYFLIAVLTLSGLSIMSSCKKEDTTVKTDTYIFLVHRNDDVLTESITIKDFNDGKGFMNTPKIIGEGFSREFNLTIDKVNENKWNFNAKNTKDFGTVAEGNGFFTNDSIYVVFKWELFGDEISDVFSGSR